ncbi:MAG: hypothetical protein MUC63_04535, partial [Planctomycetes bacterium]|nr:hypothetical protein [Planctomycetota bacterium]
MRDRYFVRVGGEFLVEERLRSLVRFLPLNLNAVPGRRGGFDGVEPGLDLIFCENVVIYFERPVLERLIRLLYNVLAPGGYLFLGYSESLYRIEHPFQDLSYNDTFFYRRPLSDEAAGEREARKPAPSAGRGAPDGPPAARPRPRTPAGPPPVPTGAPAPAAPENPAPSAPGPLPEAGDDWGR